MKINRVFFILLAAFLVLPSSNIFSQNDNLSDSGPAVGAASASGANSSLSSSATTTRRPKKGSDANLIGHVVDNEGNHMPYVTIMLKGTTIGTRTDNTGHFQIVNINPGVYTVVVRYIGFKPLEQEIKLVQGETFELKVELQPGAVISSEVVVTADRYATNRKEASVIVNTISPTTLEATQSTVISEGLNFCPGLRMENNCQNCGFNQVRMNGMEGPYSQILINSRPIFSGLAGVYGLELIPSNMIDQIEVVRGGGSALYGSNAIAGTINLILKDPVSNYFEAGFNSALIGTGVEGGDIAPDNTLSVNATTVSSDKKAGIALYGYYRNRPMYDANGDDFSEMSMIDNTTFGSRLFYRPGSKSKIALDFFNINESRRGGDLDAERPLHEADIAEAVDHKITSGALTFSQYFRDEDELSVYASAQNVARDSYYGAEQSLSDYGKSEGLTYAIGSTYSAGFGLSKVIGGVEYTGDMLKDVKLGYPEYDEEKDETIHVADKTVADQFKSIYGVFGQYEFNWDRFKATAGLRFDSYSIEDKQHPEEDAVTGNVFSPRVSLMYDIMDDLQFRTSYSTGYRAPQIFDEDLHILSSGLYQIVHANDPNLEQETSQSIMASLDYNTSLGKIFFGLLVEGFYTMLDNPFVHDYRFGEDEGSLIKYRTNAESGAKVAGVNVEANFMPTRDFSISGGFTLQISEYDDAQEDFNEKAFYRTPDSYGFINFDWDAFEDFCLTGSASYTGSMLVPYFGLSDKGIPNYDPEVGALIESGSFIDLGLKASYKFYIAQNALQVSVGVKNILNSYQDDFDSGIYRDPAYIYGPGAPRTVYLGIKVMS
jgi:outer membrane receptor for ferrienterochelin and colicins